MIFDKNNLTTSSFFYCYTFLQQTHKQNIPCNCFIISIIFFLFSSCFSLTHSPTSGNCYSSFLHLLSTSTFSLPSHTRLAFSSFADFLFHGTN